MLASPSFLSEPNFFGRVRGHSGAPTSFSNLGRAPPASPFDRYDKAPRRPVTKPAAPQGGSAPPRRRRRGRSEKRLTASPRGHLAALPARPRGWLHGTPGLEWAAPDQGAAGLRRRRVLMENVSGSAGRALAQVAEFSRCVGSRAVPSRLRGRRW